MADENLSEDVNTVVGMLQLLLNRMLVGVEVTINLPPENIETMELMKNIQGSQKATLFVVQRY